MAGQMAKLKRYLNWIVFGLNFAIPKAVNWSKLQEVRQDRNENPTDFLNGIKEAARKYTNLDLEAPAEQNSLAYLFICLSARDIRKKLQKMDGIQDICELLNAAWEVYENRDSRDRDRHQHKKRGHQRTLSGPPRRGSPPPFPLGNDQCAICKKKGHWKNECLIRVKKTPPAPELAVNGN